MDKKYHALLGVLDKIRNEAPAHFPSYKDNSSDKKISKARSLAFIHLLLKVRFGLTNFEEREKHITEGPQDGGVDAYFIDNTNKVIYFIQSKFRNNENNFVGKSISADDLIKMDLKNIVEGQEKDSRNVEFNKKIKDFIKKYSNLENHARYTLKVIFLGNIHNYSEPQIKRLTENFEYEIYDFERTYNKLLFPICKGIYFKPEDIFIKIGLSNKQNPLLRQTVNTEYGDFEVFITFVPVKEIGRIMVRYKNALLKYNPRNYLSLSKNEVNKKIAESITKQKNNSFAILNNGLTILANHFNFSQGTGKQNRGEVVMNNPQIINGGQTAYTLGSLYHNYKEHEAFEDKEVLIKVVVGEDVDNLDYSFITNISDATNQQTRVNEADRRANDKIQVEIQKKIFDNFGYYYERKKGEFYPGISEEYIDKTLIIKRDSFLRAYYASKGSPAHARSAGQDSLFSKKKFDNILENSSNFKKMFFSYLVHNKLTRLDKEKWGYGVRYGKFAIVYAIMLNVDIDQIGLNIEEYEKKAEEKVEEIKEKWKNFEDEIRKKDSNKDYEGEEGDFDFDGYYKGKTLAKDIREFFEEK